MSKSRTFYAKRNIIFGFINRVVTLTLPFIIRTIIIQKLGAEYLGLNGLFSAILQAFSMAEMGFSSAIVFRMYKPLAINDDSKVCALLSFYRRVYRRIGIGIAVAALLLMPFIGFLIKGEYPGDINIYALYLIFLSGTVISYLGVAYKTSLLSAVQRQDVISNVDTILVFTRCIIQILMLLHWQNYYAYIIWNTLFILINNLVIALICRKMYPQYVCRGKLDKSEVEEIKTQIKGLAIGKIGQVSRNSFDSIALSMFCGLVVVGIYSNYYYIITAIGGILGVIITGITGGIGNSLAVDNIEKNYYNLKKFTFYYAWIFGWCTVCLFCLYQPFMKFWAGYELMTPKNTMILFCIYFYVGQSGQIRAIYAGASGIWWQFRFFFIAEAIANPILNFTLGYFFGMNGIIFSTIITIFVCSIIGIGKKTLNYCFKKSSTEYLSLCGVYALVTVAACLATGIICDLFPGEGITKLAVNLVICAAVPNLIFGVISLAHTLHRRYLKEVRELIVVGS